MTPASQPSHPDAPHAARTPPAERTKLRLHNTLTRRKEDFAPIDPRAVRLYVCGPTVYDFAHIGNARPVIVFDVLFRLLRRLYGPDHVIYVSNITDVDDKINARAERDYPRLPLNEAIAKVTEATERQFHEDVAALGCLPPTEEPRATQYIEKMRAMIERLVARGVAYVAEDHVLFSPSAMNALPGAPRYGTLAHRSLDEMLAGARVDVAPYKRDPMDFVLWKPSKPNEPGWPSPRGIAALGRPGWHIECSAMSMATLLEPFGGGLECDDPNRNVFDIHGGGIDLVFPHHENEIAQSCCAFGSRRMANVWLHNGFLQVESEKMSKSAGNFVTIHDLLHTSKFGNGTWPGEVLRLAMLRTHYRQPIDWTVKELERAYLDVSEWYALVSAEATSSGTIDDGVIEALCDDLNTHGAIVRLHELAKRRDFRSLSASLRFLGFSCDQTRLTRRVALTGTMTARFSARATPTVTVQGPNAANERSRHLIQDADPVHLSTAPGAATMIVRRSDGTYEADAATQKLIDESIARRNAARATKNFTEADKIRDELAALGVAIKDNKDGTTSWEPKR
ncbi:MAG: cysteine--tRNA ligase [Roseiarcus sp.]|uniref:cysteine--tRNA ligase n=1 Tax=Roseiarcus sp. TaxID=1969460 RepID=UPI003C452F06